MSRPKINEIYNGDYIWGTKNGGIDCPTCDVFIVNKGMLVEHWQAGHFDDREVVPPLGVHVVDSLGTKERLGG